MGIALEGLVNDIIVQCFFCGLGLSVINCARIIHIQNSRSIGDDLLKSILRIAAVDGIGHTVGVQLGKYNVRQVL